MLTAKGKKVNKIKEQEETHRAENLIDLKSLQLRFQSVHLVRCDLRLALRLRIALSGGF